ncbi:hypothetical protein J1N35_031590 [Gossypium stocksii]|uniref:Uncharacterized protein n=1 Tax=Gossypium stocksii TaxID=47602 RepID=A0A9D3V1Q0_9ROSI|nr:hypothetical protein J1N35_031590 [Gossypium stocksii]
MRYYVSGGMVAFESFAEASEPMLKGVLIIWKFWLYSVATLPVALEMQSPDSFKICCRSSLHLSLTLCFNLIDFI